MTIQITPAAMAAAAEALGRIGKNRKASHALKIARMKVALQRARDEVQAERKELLAQFDPDGTGWASEDDVPRELVKAHNALQAEPRTLDIGEPLSVAELLESDVQPESEDSSDLATLLYLGFLVDDYEASGSGD